VNENQYLLKKLSELEIQKQVIVDLKSRFTGDLETIPGMPSVRYTDMLVLKALEVMISEIEALKQLVTGKQ